MAWRKTPTWIFFGGASLAAHAGYVNAVGYLSATHAGLSHVTGQVTRISIEVGDGEFRDSLRALLLVSWFFFGAVISGLLISRQELTEKAPRYTVALLCESALLLAATFLLRAKFLWASNLVALGMGLQNAMASSYAGAVVRTTHMTGIVTDLGVMLGRALKGIWPERAQVRILLGLFFGFLAGGGLGTALSHVLNEWALLPPALSLALMAAGYQASVFRHAKK